MLHHHRCIRQESPEDYDKVSKVIVSAFREDPDSDHKEQDLVSRLRKSIGFLPGLSLVAEYHDEIVGYILFTPIYIEDSGHKHNSLALAPIAVAPQHQNKGVGRHLIQQGHSFAHQMGFKSAIVLGHQHYYPRFGYRPVNQFGIRLPFEAPDENCMAIELEKDALKYVTGMVVYPPEFYK